MIVILTEEESMDILLKTLISKNFPGLAFHTIPFKGKQDLEKGIPNVLKNWKDIGSPTSFIVVHDQDSWDCKVLKKELSKLCNSVRKGVFVRIACHELESWYWGDTAAVDKAFEQNGKFLGLSKKARYRIPDNIVNPKYEIQKHLPKYGQISGAELIGSCMSPQLNTSYSFNLFWNTLSALVAAQK